MALTRPVTGIINNPQCGPRVEFMARRRAVCINAAPNLLPNLACQGNASGRRFVSAFHAHQFWRQYYGHRRWYTRTINTAGQFGRMKVHPIGGTASTATFADGKR